jgi:hypothetical protein
MISKSKFVYIINRLKDYDTMQKEIQNIMNSHVEARESDFTNAGGICIGHESVVVDLLKEIFKDESDIISWWLWELDYGREYSQGCISESDGTDIDLSTPEKLYDYLVENRK